MPEGSEARRAADRIAAKLVHAVFGRAGRPCYRCGTVIEKTSIASGRLYFRPAYQGVSRLLGSVGPVLVVVAPTPLILPSEPR